MGLKITRIQLEYLLTLFKNCKEWMRYINELLDSTEEDIIDVGSKYLTILETKGSGFHICKVLDLGILDVNYSSDAFEFIWGVFNSCKRIENGKYTYYKDSTCTLFSVVQLSDSNLVYADFYTIHNTLIEKYHLNIIECCKLIYDLMYFKFGIEFISLWPKNAIMNYKG